jgi:hypothetical protein
MNSIRMTNPPVGISPSGASDPQIKPMQQTCRHLRVQIVSRDEDSEFVECLECREIFESSEFKDMDIEERNAEEM